MLIHSILIRLLSFAKNRFDQVCEVHAEQLQQERWPVLSVHPLARVLLISRSALSRDNIRVLDTLLYPRTIDPLQLVL
jgi:hypothetical protein